MKLLDFFKKKKKPEIKKPEEKRLKEKKPSLTKRASTELGRSPTEGKEEKPKKKEVKIAPLVLKSPHIAEKSAQLAEINQYVFKVYPRANKTEIKKAVEEVYGVNVLKTRIIKIPRKKRRLGKTRGWRKGYKKAIVTIKQGQKIELLPR